jgi:CheY-like chemotaxis protein
MQKQTHHFLLVEDSDAHAKLVMLQLQDKDSPITVARVSDGVEALDYLCHRGSYVDAPRPDLVLLDLKLPRIDGHEVLRTIKADPDLRSIPVVVLTTSETETDRKRAYANYANSYLTKPIDFLSFQRMMKDLRDYWSVWNQPPAPL